MAWASLLRADTRPRRPARRGGQGAGGYPDTIAAPCTDIDRYGLHLGVEFERGMAYTRIGYPRPIGSIGQLRSATSALARPARQG